LVFTVIEADRLGELSDGQAASENAHSLEHSDRLVPKACQPLIE